MSDIKQGPAAGQDSDTSGLCWGDPWATRPWLTSVK